MPTATRLYEDAKSSLKGFKDSAPEEPMYKMFIDYQYHVIT